MSITARQWLILLSVQFTTILFGLTATSVTVILPQLKGADLESQLQTFDALLEHLPLLARQAFATISS